MTRRPSLTVSGAARANVRIGRVTVFVGGMAGEWYNACASCPENRVGQCS